jgi:hypothetical protein
MSIEEKIESKKLTKIFLVICIVWALYCLTNIKNNLNKLSSETETINRQLSLIDFAIRNY